MSIRAFSNLYCPHCADQVLAYYNACTHCKRVLLDGYAPPVIASTPSTLKSAAVAKRDRLEPKPYITPNNVGRPKTRRLSPGEQLCVNLFVELYGQELVVTKIANRLGHKRCTISNWLNRAVDKLALGRREDLVSWARAKA